jgi:uncharacterized coiled-coil DUF342 family protein
LTNSDTSALQHQLEDLDRSLQEMGFDRERAKKSYTALLNSHESLQKLKAQATKYSQLIEESSQLADNLRKTVSEASEEIEKIDRTIPVLENSKKVARENRY